MSQEKNNSVMENGVDYSSMSTDQIIALMGRDIHYIRRDLDELSKKVDEKFVTREEFVPVRNIVYGLVGLILTSVFVALLTVVLTK